jgi:hypothetical protein
MLRQKIAAGATDRVPELDRRSLEIALETKTEERARVLGCPVRTRIDETAINAQLDEIDAEEQSLRGRLNTTKAAEPALATAEALLERLRVKLDEGTVGISNAACRSTRGKHHRGHRRGRNEAGNRYKCAISLPQFS